MNDSEPSWTRRDFLKVGAAAGGGLLVGVGLPRCAAHDDVTAGPAAALGAFVEIDERGGVTILAPCPEIGQGVRTALPRIVAEELGADWSRVTVRQAPAEERYGGMTVGGSDSVRDYWEPLRTAGATARTLLVAAAAARWGVPAPECRARRGQVIHETSDRRLGFGDLAAEAAQLPAPENVQLREPAEFELIGRRVGRVDVAPIVDGTAGFGMDVRMPGMAYAVIERSPVHGGRVRSFDATGALDVPGVRDVVEITPVIPRGLRYAAVRAGVAVLADSTWAAFRGRQALRVEWEQGEHADASSAGIRRRFRAVTDEAELRVLRDDGDARVASERTTTRVSADYELPLLAHVCMEPVNFTADVREDRAELRGPTQAPRPIRTIVAELLELPEDRVRVTPTLAGGGFGRRLAWDYAVEAAVVSRAAGVPVQVVWTREDDIRADYYRTPSFHRMRAGLDAAGRVVFWQHDITSASLAADSSTGEAEYPELYDVQGAADQPYTVDRTRVAYRPVDVGVQTGSWRSVSHSFNIFAVESFVDELAAAAGRDPLELRLELLGEPREVELSLPLPGRRGRPRFDTGSLRRVLTTVAEAAGWGTPLPERRGRGIACCYYKGSYAAHVAEVSVDEDDRVRVDRVVAALDCGRIVDPTGLAAQVEGAAMDGVATVLKWGVTLEAGRVRQGNFDDHPMLRIQEAPKVESHLLNSDRAPTGAGEPPYPSVAPAIANAIHAAAGARVRQLPLDDGRLPPA